MAEVMTYKKMLIERFGLLEDLTVLDYGCGRGNFVELMLNQEYMPKCIYAVDSNKEAVEGVESRFAHEIKNGLLALKVCKTPSALQGLEFDKIICQNVLECIDDKVEFINQFADILAKEGELVLSHHDFDSAIYNSTDKGLMRELIHHFADTKQEWMDHADGLMGRKIPGLVAASLFRDSASLETWRIVERAFKPGQYGYLMAQMIRDSAKSTYDHHVLEAWFRDLEQKALSENYYFAIDLVVAVLRSVR